MDVKPSMPVITTLLYPLAQWMMSRLPLIPAAYDAHMGVLWVKYQIAGQRLVPRDGGAVGVLRGGPSP